MPDATLPAVKRVRTGLATLGDRLAGLVAALTSGRRHAVGVQGAHSPARSQAASERPQQNGVEATIHPDACTHWRGPAMVLPDDDGHGSKQPGDAADLVAVDGDGTGAVSHFRLICPDCGLPWSEVSTSASDPAAADGAPAGD